MFDTKIIENIRKGNYFLNHITLNGKTYSLEIKGYKVDLMSYSPYRAAFQITEKIHDSLNSEYLMLRRDDLESIDDEIYFKHGDLFVNYIYSPKYLVSGNVSKEIRKEINIPCKIQIQFYMDGKKYNMKPIRLIKKDGSPLFHYHTYDNGTDCTHTIKSEKLKYGIEIIKISYRIINYASMVKSSPIEKSLPSVHTLIEE